MKKQKIYLTYVIIILLLLLSFLYYAKNNNIITSNGEGLFLEKVGIDFNSLPQDDE